MLHLAVRLALAAVLLGAAAAKLRRPAESREALAALLARGGSPRGAAGEGAVGRGAPSRFPFVVVVAVEAALAVAVAAGLDAAALAAAALMAAGALLLARALRAGRAGAPCGCFGARSRISRAAVARAGLLAAAFAALPFVARTDPSTETWLAIGLAFALAGVAALGVAVLALAREVGMLRLAVGPQGALEIPEEGPPLGADSGLAAHLDPRPGAPLALAVFSSDGCGMCRRLAPGIAALGHHPHVSLLEFDDVRDAEVWQRLGIPGSPYAVALEGGGRVLAKGTFNSIAQLESVLASAERRAMESAGV
ncbi:MAG TPA: thioredoxin family protein [Solirubrobacteraceae bacterium]